MLGHVGGIQQSRIKYVDWVMSHVKLTARRRLLGDANKVLY